MSGKGYDVNGDGIGDYAREVAMYVVADGVYMDQYGLTGEENYVIFIHSVCPYDGKYVYPVGFYQFSADQDSFLIEHDGNKFLRWTQDVAYATYTNFNAVSYSKYYHNVLFSNGEWPASQEEYDAFMDEYGYILGDYDSYVGYLRTPEGSEAWVQEPAGLVTGGIGFYFDLDDNNMPQMPFLDVDLEFFTNLDAYGLALEQAKDEEGNLIFACKYVTDEGLCSVYDKRLRMCKKYPASKIGYPGKLHKGCGYKVEDKSFENYLKRQ